MTQRQEHAGRMKGGVRRRGPTGSWSYVIDLGKQPAQRCEDCGWRGWVTRQRVDRCPECGRTPIDTRERRLVELAGFRTRQDAVRARAEKVRTLREGTFVVPTKVSLAEYLRDTWLPAIRGEGLKPTTLVCYREPPLASDWAEFSAAKVSWQGRRARAGVRAGDPRLTRGGCGWSWRRLERRRRR